MEVILRLLVEGHYLGRRQIFIVAKTCKSLSLTCIPAKNKVAWLTRNASKDLYTWHSGMYYVRHVFGGALSSVPWIANGEGTLARCYTMRTP